MLSLNLGNLVTHLLANTTQFTKAIRGAEVLLTKFSKRTQAIGRKMSMYITAPLALIGGASVRAFGNFNDAMTQSLAIMGDVSEDMRKKMEQTALMLSGKSITAPAELAKAYFFLASAGLDASQSVGALATVEQFAVAGMFDMAQATDLLTDAQSALGMVSKDSIENMKNMTRISDVLVRANTLANASVEQFSGALTNRAAASIRMLNKDVEEGVAVLAAFADQGVKGEMAGERLAIVLRDLQRASLKETKVWAQMGLNVYDAAGKMLPLADIIEQLENKFGTMSDQQKKASAEMLGFQDRSFSALQTLLGTSNKIRIYEAALRKAGGTTKDVSDRQLTSFNSQMKILWNNITIVGIEIGETLAPWILRLSNYIKDAISWWKGLNESTQKWIVGIGVALAITGPLLVVLGLISSAVSSLIVLFSTLGIVGTLGILAIPLAIWMIVDALSEADAGILRMVNNFKIGGTSIGSYMEYVATYILQAWEWWGDQMDVIWLGFRNMVFDIGTSIHEFMVKVAVGIAEVWLKTTDLLIGRLGGVLSVLLGVDDVFKSISTSVKEIGAESLQASADASAKRAKQYADAVMKAGREQAAQAKMWTDIRDNIMTDTTIPFVKGDAAVRHYKTNVEGELKKMDSSSSGTGGAASNKGGYGMSTGQFQETSLRRISLSQLAPSMPTKKQQVQDEAVEQKLDQIYQALSDRKAATAVLG